MTTVRSARWRSEARMRETSRARIAPETPTMEGPPPVSPLPGRPSPPAGFRFATYASEE